MKSAPITETLYQYIIAQRTRTVDPVLDELTAETKELGDIAGMQISPDQSSFLTLMVAALGVKNAIEIGTFTGTSALSIARGLPADGKLLCLDASDEWTSIARKYWEMAGVSGKIELRLGDARETVSQLGEASFDFAFIDADKTGYDTYYEAVLPKLRANGLIIFDNMLRHGAVIDPQNDDDHAIVGLNAKLAADNRVECVLIPVADGLMMCRKL